MIREVGRCGHVLTRAQGFSRSYNVECGDVADSPCHERKPLGAYRPDKFGGNATWRPRAWTGPVPRDVMARYCDDGALAARLCERIAQSLAEVAA